MNRASVTKGLSIGLFDTILIFPSVSVAYLVCTAKWPAFFPHNMRILFVTFFEQKLLLDTHKQNKQKNPNNDHVVYSRQRDTNASAESFFCRPAKPPSLLQHCFAMIDVFARRKSMNEMGVKKKHSYR